MEILRIILPVVLAGAIGIFVVLRMKHKYKKGTLGKKKNQNAQYLLDSLFTIGILAGSSVGVIISLFFSWSLLNSISIGAGIGLLCGYVAYEIYSKMGTEHS
ncbi:hypothetical protein [Ornithinibacillus halophilus]|uniref:Uncharacterized protein n=1 Tax=Ornithinibacillus halophilus TaxID=930117 RepID=A0A1M5L9A7_9BACI|nr:hypothetical protein [Ornithinibacillus halophilus]SHG61329.1 hypothetical protein SAMN05216225_104511 [Ornithinibacillus halophilus]